MIIINNNLFTQIIALIGCITGICSLVLNFYKILSEKPRIKFEDYRFYLNGFYDNDDGTYESNKILIINLRILNISIFPISLKGTMIKYNNLILEPHPEYKLNRISFKHDDKSGIHYTIDKQIIFPLTIEPMQIINCSLVFPFADELFRIYDEDAHKPMEIDLNLLTANKKLKFKTKIFELTEKNIKNYQNENKEKLYKM